MVILAGFVQGPRVNILQEIGVWGLVFGATFLCVVPKTGPEAPISYKLGSKVPVQGEPLLLIRLQGPCAGGADKNKQAKIS